MFKGELLTAGHLEAITAAGWSTAANSGRFNDPGDMRGILTNTGNINTKIISKCIEEFFDLWIKSIISKGCQKTCGLKQTTHLFPKRMWGIIEWARINVGTRLHIVSGLNPGYTPWTSAPRGTPFSLHCTFTEPGPQDRYMGKTK